MRIVMALIAVAIATKILFDTWRSLKAEVEKADHDDEDHDR